MFRHSRFIQNVWRKTVGKYFDYVQTIWELEGVKSQTGNRRFDYKSWPIGDEEENFFFALVTQRVT